MRIASWETNNRRLTNKLTLSNFTHTSLRKPLRRVSSDSYIKRDMNLCIDQGNSRTKIALFKDGRIVKNLIYKLFTSTDVERLFSLYPISNAIVSSVLQPAMQ